MAAKLIKEFSAIRSALQPDDPEVGHEGQNLEKARQLADAYVEAHPDEFEKYHGMDITELVAAVDVYRQAGMLHDMWHVDTWMLHEFEPQQIGAVSAAAHRRPHGDGK